jgi:cold-inducible RNA-binding protein
MDNKIYVGNLSYSIDNSKLEELFSSYGKVESAKVITDRDSGRSKGFGFVEMSTADEADAAIDELNQKEIDGRQLNVSKAKPQKPRENSRGGRGGGGGGGGRRW